VIEKELGTKVETLYALSRRSDPMDAVCDLRSREGTTLRNIGFIDVATDKSLQSRDPEVAKIIKDWATERSIEFVVWADLESNFRRRKCTAFSFERALDYLRGLSSDGIREAVKYIVRTPKQINTGFRQWLASDKWFKEQVALFENNK
jgi:hypothetical protein